MSEVLLRLDDIHVRFANQNVLEGAQLQVHRGEIVTLIGPNGAGKPTQVRAVLGLHKPDHGPGWRKPRRRGGYKPQKRPGAPPQP
ncbi:MAG: ATP-binding cassette domain-containing protein, partial [Pseudomonas sp.]|nr:ATP-binding cassette domain-containing protein [Pseudomonas sp.]